MFKGILLFASKNAWLLVGILVGLYISNLISTEADYECTTGDKIRHLLNKNENATADTSTSGLRKLPMKKINSSEKKTKPFRPRYYSTELGIRQKIFVGIFTSEDKVNTNAVTINSTLGHLVDKLKFFITAQYKLKTKFTLNGLVGFTDTRHKFRPFQVIKYIGDTFGVNYDYYFLANDYTHINIRRLNDVIKKISVSMDVYLGNRIEDSSFCNLDAGIIISSSVLKAMREHLDWCVMNAVSDDHSENIGRCVFHSIGLSCEEIVQEQRVPTFKLKHFEASQHLSELSKRKDFNDAVTIYPILQVDDFHLLNAYFLKKRLEMLKSEIDDLSDDLVEVWPPGSKAGAKPATRYDLPRQVYFNLTHVFFPDDFTNVRNHTGLELKDIENVLEEIKGKVDFEYQKTLKYTRLVNGYKTFDFSRGMEYVLDVGFKNYKTGKEIVKRFEVFKPLGKVEIIPVPYVTENSRVTVLLPVQEWEVHDAIVFLNSYSTIMNRKEKSLLMLVLLYQYDTPSKGDTDIYRELKELATRLTNKYISEDNKVAWLSVRLPNITVEQKPSRNECPTLDYALVDLAVKKIGGDSLVLLLDVHCNVTADFLNRVRMNTIQNYQIFNPIPFRHYNPKIARADFSDINKNVGHFDKESFRYVSFYANDYINARKITQRWLPLTRVDEDISNVLGGTQGCRDIDMMAPNLVEMFLRHSEKTHCMRATDFGLRVKYHEEIEKERHNLFLGNEAQLARLMLSKEDSL